MHERISTNSSDNADEAPVAFIDSGVGGLPYLAWAKENIPDETYVYLADRENFPYGTKTPGEVYKAVSAGVDKLILAVHPKLIVVACNTASVVALSLLRDAYPNLPFIGTVPAVKPAAALSRTKKIGVLATERTVRDVYMDNLIERFASDCEVVRVAGPEIVNFVENKLFSATPEERDRVISESAALFREKNVDQIVLGCTHFLYIADELRNRLGGGIELVDSREGVGRRIQQLLGTRVAKGKRKGRDRMYLTGSRAPEARYAYFAEKFGLELAGTL